MSPIPPPNFFITPLSNKRAGGKRELGKCLTHHIYPSRFQHLNQGVSSSFQVTPQLSLSNFLWFSECENNSKFGTTEDPTLTVWFCQQEVKALKLPPYLDQMTWSDLTSEGRSKTYGAWEINARDQSGPKYTKDKSLKSQLSQTRHPRSPQILKSKASVAGLGGFISFFGWFFEFIYL